MNEEKKEKIWLEIRAALNEELRGKSEDEKTITELSEEWGIPMDRTRELVKRLVANKVLLQRGGRKVKIFVKPNPEVKDFAEAVSRVLNKN